MVKNIKNNLTNIVVIIGLIGSIGAGFIKYGEVMTKLDVLEGASMTVDKVSIEMVAVLEEKVKVLESKKEHKHKPPTDVSDIKTQIKINETEIKLLKNIIEEIKIKSSNPLSN